METMTSLDDSIINSIDRSSVRKKILLYLNHCSKATMYDIAKDTKINYTNVTGGIAGYGKRYGKERSLVHLGLVERETGVRGLTVYSLTPIGQKLANALDQ